MNIPYVSNELFHFVGRHEANDEARYYKLVDIVKSGFLTGCFDDGENGERHPVKGGPMHNLTPFRCQGKDLPEEHPWRSEDLTEVEAVCLCDIPTDSLGRHMQYYSKFGLSFDKVFVISKGGNPMNYVCFDSLDWVGASANSQRQDDATRETLKTRFGEIYVQFMNLKRLLRDYKPQAIDFDNFDRDNLGQVWALFESRFQDHVLNFIKPFRQSTEPDAWNNFYMEREWRVPGYFEFTLSDIAHVVLPEVYAERLQKDLPDLSEKLLVVKEGTADETDSQ